MEIIDYKALYEASLLDNSLLKIENDKQGVIISTLKVENAEQRVENAALKVENAEQRVENAALKVENAEQRVENTALKEERTNLLTELDKLRQQLFGFRSDNRVKAALKAIEVDESKGVQLSIFSLNTPETVVDQIGEQLKEDVKKQQSKQKKHTNKPKRLKLPEHLERREVVINPDIDLSDYHIIGAEKCEVLVIEPMKMWVKAIVRNTWAINANCKDIEKKAVITAPAPSRTVNKGMLDESVLAFLLINKYIYHLPLHRTKQMFTREQIPISSSTLSNNVSTTIRTLEPIYRALVRETLSGKYLQSDETTYKVLRGDKKGKCHTGYMWAFNSPPNKLIFYQYCPTRHHMYPKEVLKDFKGVLQSDCYAGYKTALAGNEDIKHLYCLAHLRRKLDECAKNDLERAQTGIEYIASIYAIEKSIREADPKMSESDIVMTRYCEVRPIMDKMKEWMQKEYENVLPKSPIGKAISYGLKMWNNMYIYLLHGELLPDNNEIESGMRRIALSRKNSLFSGTHQTAQDSAMIFSLFETCKRNNVDPENWLKDVLYKINDPEYEGKYSDLLPNRWQKAQ